MDNFEWIVFNTPIGVCSLSWKGKIVFSFHLPEQNIKETIFNLQKITNKEQQCEQIPFWVQVLVKKVLLHLRGKHQNFNQVPLDLERITRFQKHVYLATQSIPSGQTRTYLEIAHKIEKPLSARAVGQALSKNPFPLLVPCHRVLASGNKPGGFSAHGGLKTKSQLLACEGIDL